MSNTLKSVNCLVLPTAVEFKFARRRSGSLLRSTALAPVLRPWRWLALSIVGAATLLATQAMAIDVASQTDWNTAVAAVATAGAGTTVSINVTSGFTLTSSLAQLQASNTGVTVNITGNSQTIDGASAFQGIQVDGSNAPTVNISSLSVANTAVRGGNGENGQNGYYSAGLSYGAGGGGGGGLGAGGGLLVGSGANVTLAMVTFTGNTATGGNGGNGGIAQNGAADPVNGGAGGAGGTLNNGGVTGGGGAGGTGGNSGTQGTAGSAGSTLGAGGGGGGGSGTTNSTSYTSNNAGGTGNGGAGGGRPGGDGVTNNNGSQGPGADGGSGGNGGGARGGAIYVATGGTLTVLDTPISGAVVAGGVGGSNGIGQGPSSINGGPGSAGVVSGAGIYLGGVTANIGVSTGNVTYASTIGGTGLVTGGVNTAINKTGAGTLTLSAVNDFTGNVAISGGTLSIGASNNLGNANNDVAIANGGTLAVTATTTLAAGRAFSLAGSGGFAIANGTTTTLQGIVSDGVSAGSLSKSNTGTLVLSGINTYSGSTEVLGGTLRAGSAGAFGSSAAFAVAANSLLDLNGFDKSFGTLSGAGTVGGAKTTITGTFAPGNGTPGSSMAINGDLAFQTGAQYVVQVDPTTASSASVTGTAAVKGARVQVQAANGTYAPATTYTILTSAGGRDGPFDGVSSNLAFLDPTLSYGATNVDLTLTRNDQTVSGVVTPPTQPGPAQQPATIGTPNQRAVAGAIDRLGAGNPVYDSLMGLSTDQVPGALQQVTGESYATDMQIIGSNAALFSQSLMGRMGGIGDGAMAAGAATSSPVSGYFEASAMTAASAAISGVLTPSQPAADRRIAWFAPVGARGRVDGDGNAVPTRWSAGGITGGYEFTETMAGGEFLGGVAFGYLRGNASASENLTSVQSDSGQAGIYGRWENGPLTISGSLAAGLGQSRAERHIVYGATDVTAESRTWSQTVDATAEVSYALPLSDDFTLSPLATMFGLVAHRNGVTETGAGAFNLDIDGNTQSELTPGLGVELSHLTKGDNGELRTTARAVWEHALLDGVDQSMRFAGTQAAFSVDAPDTARNRLRLGFGVEYKTNSRWSLFADYEGLFSSSEHQHAGRLGAKVSF